MNPLITVDLAGEWRFTPEGQAASTIQVPGGGWLKQGFDCEAAVYERWISVPNAGQPQVTRLELGTVNHEATYSLGTSPDDLRPIGSEVTAFTPQVIDLTPHVQSGQRYLLRIAVRAYRDGRPIAPHWAEWSECVARGIFGEAALRVYPAVFVSDIFPKTSVAHGTLGYEAAITNGTDRAQTVTLTGDFLAQYLWRYPALPSATVLIPARATEVVTLEDIPWTPGPDSYWRPNLPYAPDYRTHLHTLRLTVSAAGLPPHTALRRFGFRELRQVGDRFELNGVRVNFRGDNLQVANYDRVNNGGQGDAIHTLPGFLPPSDSSPGWPQAVDNFLRLNYNAQRQHMGPWSPYMLDVCDELGLMLFGESASRWNGFDMENDRGFHEVKCLQDIIRRDRHHPCIVRWSTKNEAHSREPEYHVELYEAVKFLDDTRPIYEDFLTGEWDDFNADAVFGPLVAKDDFCWIHHYVSRDSEGKPYFTITDYNDGVVPEEKRPFGIGEANWPRGSTPAGLVWFATAIALGRAQGASDMRPYVLLSSWASSIPGVKTTDFLTEENRRPVYGEDNLPDPWSHPGIQLLQQACHPLLAMDREFWRLNREGDALGHFPTMTPPVAANTTVTRTITVFNDDLAGEALELIWEVREGHRGNWIFDQGSVALRIPCGTRIETAITFHTPPINTYAFLTLRVYKDKRERFVDSLTCFQVIGGEDFRSTFNGEERAFI